MRDGQDQGSSKAVDEQAPIADGQADRFPEFEELRRQVALRIRDNQRFLEGIFDDDFTDEDDDGVEGEDASFEEL